MKKLISKIVIAITIISILGVSAYYLNIYIQERRHFNEIDALFNTLEGYDDLNSKKYVAYHDKYPEADVLDVIILINNNIDEIIEEYNPNVAKYVVMEGFDRNRLLRYLAYEDKYNSPIEETIKIVERDYDLIDELPYFSQLLPISEEKYFILSRFNRYYNYWVENQQVAVDEIVKSVNCNLDYEVYSNYKEANLEAGNLILVNKYYYLSEDYIPDNLVQVSKDYSTVTTYLTEEANAAFELMCEDAKKEKLYLSVNSVNAYRDYSSQQKIFNLYKRLLGEKQALLRAAYPGYSEHQTGLALDIAVKNKNSNYTEKTKFNWLIENCYKYGFILRYPSDQTQYTLYSYERWHYRYVGIEVATYIHETNITLEEYYAYFIEK